MSLETFATVPLTDSQRLVVLTHEENTRVVAGAGAGKTSVIVAKAGYFYSCSNYPYCTHNARVCPQCGTGYLVPGQKTLKCNNENCSHMERLCPRCRTGWLVERKGKYGIFLGCTNYSSGKCNYTEIIISYDRL